MRKETFKLLSKNDLIQIILSDSMWERKAFYTVLKLVGDKIDAIIDQQDKCDISTVDGWKKYLELEKEYRKWSGIQANL